MKNRSNKTNRDIILLRMTLDYYASVLQEAFENPHLFWSNSEKAFNDPEGLAKLFAANYRSVLERKNTKDLQAIYDEFCKELGVET